MHWLTIFIEGIVFGIGLALMSFGPAFFSLLQTSVKRGFWSGASMAFGVSMSDIVYISISYIGISHWVEGSSIDDRFGIIGGIIMLAFGIFSIMRKKEKLVAEDKCEAENTNKLMSGMGYLGAFLKGFLLNGINPILFVFWFGVVGAANAHYDGWKDLLLFFSTGILFVFCLDLTKAYLANRIAKRITPNLMMWINRAVGVILIFFSLRLFFPEKFEVFIQSLKSLF